MAGLFDSFCKESYLLNKGYVMQLIGFNFYASLIRNVKKYIRLQFLKFQEFDFVDYDHCYL
jgi:hypothetical protein